MNIHMLLLLTVMAVTLLFIKSCDIKEDRRLCVVLVTVIMTLFSGLRAWWFGDLISYYTLYRKCVYGDFHEEVLNSYRNVGIRIFFKLMGEFGLSYEVCIFVIAAFSASTLGILVYRYSPSVYMSYLLYIAMGFYMFTYSGLKQTIAMGFVILGVMAMFENKLVRFLFWILIAGSFHAPAFILLPVYFISKKKIDYIYFIGYTVVILYAVLNRNNILSFFTDVYYENGMEYNGTNSIGGRVVMMILIMLLAFSLRKINQDDKIYIKVFHLMLIAVAVQLFSMYDNVFTRLADYTYQFVVLFIPLMLENAEHQIKMKKENGVEYSIRQYEKFVYVFLFIGISLFSLWFYNRELNNNEIFLKDYKFNWQIDAHALYGER